MGGASFVVEIKNREDYRTGSAMLGMLTQQEAREKAMK